MLQPNEPSQQHRIASHSEIKTSPSISPIAPSVRNMLILQIVLLAIVSIFVLSTIYLFSTHTYIQLAFYLLPGILLLFTLSCIALLNINNRVKKEANFINQKIFLTLENSPSREKNTEDNVIHCESLEFLCDVNKHVEQLTEHYYQKVNLNLKDTIPDTTENHSKQKRQQHELEIARESAAQANRIKSKIIANTSHELLTPLNSIVGFSKLLIQQQSNATQSLEFAKRINENALHLTTLVNDLVLFSDRKHHGSNIKYQTTNLYDLLQSISHSFTPDAENKGLEFIVNYDSIYGMIFEADAARIRQILYNLIVNAIRNTNKGHILLSAQLGLRSNDPDQAEANLLIAPKTNSSSNQSSFLTISIEDTGCGIEKERQEEILTEFISHKHNHIDDNNPGLGFGLGLSIVSEIIQWLGGSLVLQSHPGIGSRFDIAIPMQEIKEVSDNAAHSKNDSKTTTNILLVGDYTPSLNQLEDRLNNYFSSSKKTTINYFSKEDIHSFSHIIIDVDMKSYTQFKSSLDDYFKTLTKSTATIIVLIPSTLPIPTTFYSLNNTIKVINKPPQLNDLLGIQNEPEQQKISVAKKNNVHKPNILITDDSHSNALLLDHLLQNLDCNVDVTLNGHDAVKKASERQYELILLDIRMQPIDGFQTLKSIRATDLNKHTPIIACTAHTSQLEYRKLQSFGFSQVIHKPINVDELDQLLNEHHLLHQTSQKHISKESPAFTDHNNIKDNIKNETLFDPATAIERTSGNVDVAEKLFRLLLDEIEKSLSLHENQLLLSTDELLEHIHQLNGAAAMSGALKMKSLANDLETELKREIDFNQKTVNVMHQLLIEHMRALTQWASQQDLKILFTSQQFE